MRPLTSFITFTKGLTRNFAPPTFIVVLFELMRGKKTKLTRSSSLDSDPNEERLEELLRQNSMKDRLLSIIAHDIRSPLYSLQSLLSLHANGKVTSKELQQVTGGLDTQVGQLLQFVDNILTWAKNNRDDIQPKFEQVSLRPLVKETIDLLSPLAARKHIIIHSSVLEDLVVFADSEMVKLILRNLITNSIKFCYPEDSIYIAAKEQGNNILISVHDTGPGIPSVNLSKLFEQTHLSTKGTRNEIGFALGLTLCQEFVEKMGGTIRVTSVEGNGSSFEFTLHSPTSASPSFQRFIEVQERQKVNSKKEKPKT